MDMAIWKQHLALTANTRALLRKGRYDTTRLSQRRARGPKRQQLAVRCTAQKQARFNKRPINAVSLANYIAKGAQREIPAATCLSNTTAERGRISYPRGLQQSQPPQYLSHLLQCRVYSACRLSSGRPTAVTTGTLFITLTKVQSILHADYHQGGLYSFIATYSLLKLDSIH